MVFGFSAILQTRFSNNPPAMIFIYNMSKNKYGVCLLQMYTEKRKYLIFNYEIYENRNI